MTHHTLLCLILFKRKKMYYYITNKQDEMTQDYDAAKIIRLFSLIHKKIYVWYSKN